MTYLDLNAALQKRCKHRRKLASNTWAIRRNPSGRGGIIDLRYHNTDILSFYPNGDISINIGQWFTVTTKQRLNQYLPNHNIYSVQGEWFLCTSWSGRIAVFTNGMVIHADGRVTGAMSYVDWDTNRRKRIHRARSDGARLAASTRAFARASQRILGDYA